MDSSSQEFQTASKGMPRRKRPDAPLYIPRARRMESSCKSSSSSCAKVKETNNYAVLKSTCERSSESSQFKRNENAAKSNNFYEEESNFEINYDVLKSACGKSYESPQFKRNENAAKSNNFYEEVSNFETENDFKSDKNRYDGQKLYANTSQNLNMNNLPLLDNSRSFLSHKSDTSLEETKVRQNQTIVNNFSLNRYLNTPDGYSVQKRNLNETKTENRAGLINKSLSTFNTSGNVSSAGIQDKKARNEQQEMLNEAFGQLLSEMFSFDPKFRHSNQPVRKLSSNPYYDDSCLRNGKKKNSDDMNSVTITDSLDDFSDTSDRRSSSTFQRTTDDEYFRFQYSAESSEQFPDDYLEEGDSWKSNLPDSDFRHVIEIYDFPERYESSDLWSSFYHFRDCSFFIKRVDDTHALGVFSTPMMAKDALSINDPYLKVRPFTNASFQSKATARVSKDVIEALKQRPATNASVAKRMIVCGLGIKRQQRN